MILISQIILRNLQLPLAMSFMLLLMAPDCAMTWGGAGLSVAQGCSHPLAASPLALKPGRSPSGWPPILLLPKSPEVLSLKVQRSLRT